MGKTRNKTIKLLSEKERREIAEREAERLRKLSAANKFDKIIKENAPESIDRVIEIALNLKMISCEDYPSEVQYTLERRPDFLKKVVEEDGTSAIWHGEYQVPDEKKMIFRFLVYCGLFKRNEGNILVRQFAIYLGTEPPQMQTEINDVDLFFRFHLIPIINIPFESLLESGNPEEAILAVLANLQGEKPENVIRKIIQTIVKNSDSDLEKQKHIQQLHVMSQLRNFEPLIDNIMESENLLEYVSVERTWYYKQGVKAAEAKFEKKFELHEQKRLKEQEQRRKEDEQRRKEDEQRRKEDERQRQEKEQLIAALLLSHFMSKEHIAPLVSSHLDLIESIEAKIQKTQKLLDADLLTTEEIASVVKVSIDFVKLVIDKNNE